MFLSGSYFKRLKHSFFVSFHAINVCVSSPSNDAVDRCICGDRYSKNPTGGIPGKGEEPLWVAPYEMQTTLIAQTGLVALALH